ncbi:MAG: hypothetical protein IK008_02795 [Bacteroidales bacterium]|nr:hypothetical protein [Bacteroidales bacterium]
MATRTDSPLVAALLGEVEISFGRPVRTPSDFILLASQIEEKTREHISDSTIKRLWKSSLSYKTVSDRSLNVLSQFAGYPHFHAFKDELAKRGIEESELVTGEECVKTSELHPGDRVRIAWQPDRECLLEYLGHRKFKAIETLNSKMKPGDTFCCSVFIKGRALYVDDFTQGTEVYESYGMGTEHGLIRVTLER